MRTRANRPAALAAVALAGAMVLSACSSSDDASASDTAESSPTATATPTPTATATATPAADLPEPEAGVVTVDGSEELLSTRMNRRYDTDGGDSQLVTTATGDSRAFQRLCVGELDVVDSSRPISASEWQQCQDAGLDIVQFQVAADATLLAIKNESDVGGDCLDTEEAARILEANSTIDNWSEVASRFDDVPLATGGPQGDDPLVVFFGRYVLGAPEPSLLNFRADYRAAEDEDSTRIWVAGTDADRLKVRNFNRVTPKYNRLRAELKIAWRVWGDANDEVKVALRERNKGIRDDRDAATRASDEARLQRAYRARSRAITEVNLIKAKLKPVQRRYRTAADAQARLDSTNGHLGLFRLSYYQVYENLLRPFEIDVAGDGVENCIFPSPATVVSGEYPLTRQLLLTTTTRSLQREEVQDYLLYYLRNSQTLATDADLIALPTKDVQTQVQWITSGDTPTFASVDGGPVELVETPEEEQQQVEEQQQEEREQSRPAR
ncbi:MAG: hypothetical protein CMH83_00540 [Nocardioides sp.]|nr:hypothetical protein [Nocardioides sp.]